MSALWIMCANRAVDVTYSVSKTFFRSNVYLTALFQINGFLILQKSFSTMYFSTGMVQHVSLSFSEDREMSIYLGRFDIILCSNSKRFNTAK